MNPASTVWRGAIWLLILAAYTFGKCASERTANTDQPRIVGGNATTIAQAPYVINLRRNTQFICGGSIITPNCVLTAAHCVSGSTPAQAYTVHAGVSRLSAPGIERRVGQYYLPPAFDIETLDMDVAVLSLTQPLGTTRIRTIGIAQRRPHVNEHVQIFGWGLTSEYAVAAPDQLRTVSVRVVAALQCQAAYAGKALLTPNMFCASVLGERDSCSGDSGGPVVCERQLCGIVSWGFGCARQQYPGVYTNLASERVAQFVRQTVQRHCT